MWHLRRRLVLNRSVFQLNTGVDMERHDEDVQDEHQAGAARQVSGGLRYT